MTDFTKDLEIGDKVLFQGYPDMYGDDCPLLRNDWGIVIELPNGGSSQNKFKIFFEGKGQFDIFHYDLVEYRDIDHMDPRQKIQWEYSEWVDEYTDMLEKSHVTMQEVQNAYSHFALNWVIKELKAINQTEEIRERIKYLETLYESNR